jgi:hypothetical protein
MTRTHITIRGRDHPKTTTPIATTTRNVVLKIMMGTVHTAKLSQDTGVTTATRDMSIKAAVTAMIIGTNSVLVSPTN